jgi:transcription antitermination protein NusB
MKNKKKRQARQTRLAIIQVLYQYLQLKSNLFEATKRFIIKETAELDFENNKKYTEKIDISIFYTTIRKFIQVQTEIYQLLQIYLPKGKKLSDMDKIIEAILLAGTAEIIANKTPAKVIVSEYISISYGFFKGNEWKIINAVLDSVLKKHVPMKQ